MDSDKLPISIGPQRRTQSISRLFGAIVLAFFLTHASFQFYQSVTPTTKLPLHAAETLSKCRSLHNKPGPPPDFHLREKSDRYEKGTRPTLLRNATIWTGQLNGLETITGDILLDGGLIKAVGKIAPRVLNAYMDLVIVDLDGAWVTPGFVWSSHVSTES